MGNPLMGAPPPQQQMPVTPPSQDQIDDAHTHAKVLTDGLMDLVNKPQGQLNKQDVFKMAADVIAKGAFSTPQSKQQLVAELAQMPDDEPGIRKMLGQFLLQSAQNQAMLHHHFGPPGGQNAG